MTHELCARRGSSARCVKVEITILVCAVFKSEEKEVGTME